MNLERTSEDNNHSLDINNLSFIPYFHFFKMNYLGADCWESV